jgi:hypothetical protein
MDGGSRIRRQAVVGLGSADRGGRLRLRQAQGALCPYRVEAARLRTRVPTLSVAAGKVAGKVAQAD